MRRNKRHLRWLILAVLLGTIGCAKTPEAVPVDQEPAVRARFEELQRALKERDTEGLTRLLAMQSQADAQGVARFVRLSFARADDKTREHYRKELGISPDEMMRFNGPMFFKTQPFLKRYKEVIDGKIERISIQGDNATLYYRDEEGEQEKLLLVREEGEWKFWLPMPPVRPAEEGKEKDKKEKP
jgi:hypothetical protein